MNKRTTIGIVLGLLCMCAISFAALAPAVPVVQNEEQPVLSEPEPSGFSGVNVGYDGYVTVLKYEAAKDEWQTVEDSKHNIITNIGINFIKAKLNGSDVAVANNLSSVSLSADATAVDAAWVQLVSEIAANGLSRNGTARWSVNGTGGFNYTATWTATGSQSAQTTGLQWSSTPSSANNLFAALAFSSQSLLVNDQLQVIWQIVIS